MQARFAQENGTRAFLRVHWGTCEGKGYHEGMNLLAESDTLEEWKLGGAVEDHPEEAWPTRCDRCGEVAPSTADRQVFRKRRYDTPSGGLEPGCLFFTPWEHFNGHCLHHWENCTDPRGHLHAILPNGREWDIDSRASNCGSPEDKQHRCWVRHGEPPNVTVDKGGNTCGAGGGSIDVPGFHGFLRGGTFSTC